MKDFKTEMEEAWESAKKTLRAKGEDPDQMAKDAGEVIDYHQKHPFRFPSDAGDIVTKFRELEDFLSAISSLKESHNLLEEIWEWTNSHKKKALPKELQLKLNYVFFDFEDEVE